jgi:preprotein translocase subunit SecA
MLSLLGQVPEISEPDFQKKNAQLLTDETLQQFQAYYHRKSEHIREVLFDHIKNVHETQGNRFKRMVVPFTDGRSNPYMITAELEEAYNSKGRTIMRDIEKAVTLSIIDEKWKEHLRSMDELKESVQSASFEQKDPLVIYKMEAYKLFENLVMDINSDVSSYLAKGTLIFSDGTTLEQAREMRVVSNKTRTNKDREQEEIARKKAAASANQGGVKIETIKRQEPKIGRNDPCPCGSGKKYKNCHGR